MRRLKYFLPFLWYVLAASALTAQTVTVVASHLGGPRPVTGTITFQPALIDGTPASTALSGGNGQTGVEPIVATVTAGVFNMPNVVDTAAANPANICYKVTAQRTNQLQVLGPGYGCLQPAYNNAWCTAGVCNLDKYTPSLPKQALDVTGPGFTWRGTFDSTQSYAVNDVVSYQGSSYVNIVATAPGTSSAVVTKPNLTGNLFNSAVVATGQVVDITTGALKPIAGYQAVQNVFVRRASSVVMNLPLQVYTGGNDGYVFRMLAETWLGASMPT